MDYPKNEDQLRDCLLAAVNENRQAILDPRTTITMTKPIVISQAVSNGMPWGVNGNFANLYWKGPAGLNMLTFQGSSGVSSRGLVVERLGMDGNGYAAEPAQDCLKLYAPLGDDGPLYKFTVRDVYTMNAQRGIALVGGVYEGFLENIHCENHRNHGMECQHGSAVGVGGIISNINIVHPNLSRNFGAGLACTYSTNITMGSFILNGLGAVIAPEGLRYASACNGENTGESMFVIPWNGYGSVITGCEASSNGKTVCRKFTDGHWVDVGKPMLYLLDGATDVTVNTSHCSYYGDPPDPMRIRKQGVAAQPA